MSSLCQGCELQFLNAKLSSDFGLNLLKRKFPDNFEEILKEVGVYTKGKNQGKYRGAIFWVKCVKGGWDYEYKTGVVRRGSFAYKVVKDAYDIHSTCLVDDGHVIHSKMMW
ncbi:hypothetical protein HWD03_gp107 [Alteromonas phage vB_AmeM_PT11-V22]|uniref:Uncharacterized protein n=1 Tax=Alteromonas phage vB_AmeM_PT11-V22 TaxID=2704031 RepID=A0A6C0R1M8_9CAUD|nr:hypothetical protein HWD03_gp107 [Alteromonas phage vB_AmeM_PT11-V22]QHZ59786.1 hypothetical protein [Alteromonas phage vB_AmeM_PT11-V22]